MSKNGHLNIFIFRTFWLNFLLTHLISVCTELRGFDIGKAANVAVWWSVVIETEQIIRLPTERQRHRHEHRPAIANDPPTVRGGGYIGVLTSQPNQRHHDQRHKNHSGIVALPSGSFSASGNFWRIIPEIAAGSF